MAVRYGISKDEFFHSTLKDIYLRIDIRQKELENEAKQTEYSAWLTGVYVLNAITCAFSKKHRYPKNPIAKEEIIVEDMELTEEEKEMWRERLFEKLRSMTPKNKSCTDGLS